MVRELTMQETDRLIARHIGPHPSNRGMSEYWLKEPGVPVWAIVGMMMPDGSDVEATAALWHITADKVRAAWAFYERHRAAIDTRIDQNRADTFSHFATTTR